MLNRTEYVDPHQESSFELVSVYINEYRELNDDERHEYEHEITARRLPLPTPSMGEPWIDQNENQSIAAKKKPPIDRETFVSFMFLLYILTGMFYAWYYLTRRIILGDVMKGTRLKIILTLISIVYIVTEILLVNQLFSD
jgi:hypothetical protein